MIKLKNLTESIENKYRLNESSSSILVEKFSDDMPDWLAKRLLTTKYSTSGRPSYRDVGGEAHFPGESRERYIYNRGQKKNPNFGKDPEYRNLDSIYGDPSLFTGLLKKDISLDTVKVIEGPVPISDTDKRLQDPNIPIFLLDNNVVYIPGVNDDEKLGSRKTLGAYSISALLPKTVKFAYIDGSDADNFIGSKRGDRYDNMSGSLYRKNSPEKGRNGRPLGGTGHWSSDYDKSGYKVIPPAEKYKSKLDEIKANKIYEIMKEYEDYLTDAQQEIANYISSLSMKEYRSNYDTIKNLQTRLNDSIAYYVTVDEHINEIVNDNITDEQKRDNLIKLINSDWPYRWEGIKDLDREVVRLKDASKEVFNATIDWI